MSDKKANDRKTKTAKLKKAEFEETLQRFKGKAEKLSKEGDQKVKKAFKDIKETVSEETVCEE